MKDYKKMLHWLLCHQPRFEFELDEPIMVVWLHGDEHVVQGANSEELIEKGIELEEFLIYEEDRQDEEWEREQYFIRQAEQGIPTLSACYCDIVHTTCNYCKGLTTRRFCSK